jgi:hypothetical protein
MTNSLSRSDFDFGLNSVCAETTSVQQNAQARRIDFMRLGLDA